ncbi:MAG: MCE family protein [Alphaproteobacteria bacterium]|nr:MCE family protein [Alphaproteobacteria bacterium]
MSDQRSGEQRILPTARSQRKRRFPLIWLVPVITALIGLWLAWDTYSKRGPTITIAFDQGYGLQVGQSQLKYRDVAMGTVKGIEISKDFSKVIVTVETTNEAKRFLNDRTVFWVVKPELFAGKVSGLDTLLSGSYIGMLPSPQPGKTRYDFVGQEDPPILTANVPGTEFRLEARRLGSISLGSPIFYRDLEVGAVLGWDLDNMARHVTIHAFVRAPFDKYVHDDSLFWNASGVSVKMGASGVKIELESMKSLLLGGIAFDTRPDPREKVSEANQVFPLYADHEAAMSAGFGHKLRAVSYFEGSVAGLEPGADVTLHGLKIGEVTALGLRYDPKIDGIVVPVHYTIEAERIGNIAAAGNASMGTGAAEMIRRGFRATLDTSSLLTGTKVVAIKQIPDAPPDELRREGDEFVVPSSEAGGLDSITSSAAALLTRINRIDFEAIGAGIAGTAKGLEGIVNGPQVNSTLASLAATMADARDFARKLDARAGPAMAKLPDIANQLDSAIVQVNRLAVSLNTGYGGDSRFGRELDRLIPQLNDAVRSFRALADLLSRHPEALIRGRTDQGLQ